MTTIETDDWTEFTARVAEARAAGSDVRVLSRADGPRYAAEVSEPAPPAGADE